ncbi:MAG: Sua5/YciO/YrdC/YwlC family protein, partial [Gemmatimonadales bacterium]
VSIIRVDPAETTAPRKAVEVLRSGGLLAFPTAAGYMVGCSALHQDAIRRLCAATGASPETLQRLDDSRDPIPLVLMRDADLPIAATPPRPGAPPARTAQHVIFALGDKIDLTLDAGPVHRLTPMGAR